MKQAAEQAHIDREIRPQSAHGNTEQQDRILARVMEEDAARPPLEHLSEDKLRMEDILGLCDKMKEKENELPPNISQGKKTLKQLIVFYLDRVNEHNFKKEYANLISRLPVTTDVIFLHVDDSKQCRIETINL